MENYQKVTSMRTALAEMVHPQPPTPVETDNISGEIIMNGTAKDKNRAIDMIFYWVYNKIRKHSF